MLKILTGVFIVMAVIVALPFVGRMINGNKDASAPKNISLNFSDFSESSVGKIVIKNASAEKTLSFQDGKWLIGNDEADAQKVADFFTELKGLKVGEMVSQTETNQAKFGVDSASAIQLIITKNGQDNIFLVGKASSVPNQFYMRKDGIKNTYLVESALRDKLTWDATKWQKSAPDASADKTAPTNNAPTKTTPTSKSSSI
ncbi:MAG: DUF4340 domain-containing protein [Parcubacteria group bacterium]